MKKIFLLLSLLSVYSTLNAQNQQVVCTGEDVYLHLDSPINGSITWQESTDGINFTALPNATTDTFLIPSISQGGFYRALIEEGNCDAYASEFFQISVVGTSNVRFGSIDTILCANSTSTTLSAIPSGGTFTGPGVIGNTFNATDVGVGIYEIFYTYIDASQCTSTITQNMFVNELPVVDFSGLDSNYCSNDLMVTLTGQPSGGVFSGNAVNVSQFFPSSANVGVNTTITYTYTDSNNCVGSTSKTTFVNQAPNTSISGLAFSYCNTDSSTVNLTGIPSGGVFTNTAGITGSSFSPASITPNTYQFTYSFTDANNCGSESNANFTISAAPSLANAGMDASTNLTSITLNANQPTIGTGTWSVHSGAGGSFVDANDPQSVFNGSNNTMYQLLWTVSNPPCTESVDTVEVNLLGAPLPSINCNGTLYVHPTDNHGPIAWGCSGIVSGAGDDNNGQANTSAIVLACPSPTAANICDTLTSFGFNDWYLPSYNELDCMRQEATNIGGFAAGAYWSSTEGTGIFTANARYRTFPSGVSGFGSKSNANRVRCVRR